MLKFIAALSNLLKSFSRLINMERLFFSIRINKTLKIW